MSLSRFPDLGPVSRKSRRLFGPEKPFVKLRPAYSAKLVFSYVVKGIKIKITAKFRASRRLTFEDTKRILSPEMHPKSFGTFEKQAPGDIFGFAYPFPWTFFVSGYSIFPLPQPPRLDSQFSLLFASFVFFEGWEAGAEKDCEHCVELVF